MGEDELEEAIKILATASSLGNGLDRRGVAELLDRLHREKAHREGLVADYHHYWNVAHEAERLTIVSEAKEEPGEFWRGWNYAVTEYRRELAKLTQRPGA